MRTLPASRFTVIRSAALLVSFAIVPFGTATSATGSATQRLAAILHPAAELSVPASVVMTRSGGKFNTFQAAVTVNYRVRTTAGGAAGITVQVTSDFSPSGGPAAQAGDLQYSCGGATLGKACAGTQAAAVGLQTPILALTGAACTGGGGACSSQDPNSVTVNFTLPDDPGYSTGSYSAQLTFIISAT